MNHKEREQDGWAVPYFTLCSGQVLSLLGSRVVQFALIWWLTERTGSATVLATASLVGLVPSIILLPFIGTVVDRYNRCRIMLAADSVIALATLVLALVFAFGTVEVWHVYIILFVRAIGGGFHMTAWRASTSLMVPAEHFARIQGFFVSVQGGLDIVSAPMGALLLQLFSFQTVLFFDVGTALPAIALLLFIPVPQPVHRAGATDTNGSTLWQDLGDGLRYLWSWPGLFILIGMMSMINMLLTPAFVLLPLLVTEHFGGGAPQLAWLESSLGIGAICGGLVLSMWGGFRRKITTALIGFVGIGLGYLALGMTPAAFFPVALAGMFQIGLMNCMASAPPIAIVQAAVPPAMQGRMFTLMETVVMAASPLGLLIAGLFAEMLGVRTWLIMAGLVCILTGIAGFFVPALMQIEGQTAVKKNVRAGPSVSLS